MTYDQNLDQMIRIDALTGDPNLLAFLDVLIKQFDAKSNTPKSLILLDINNFGNIERAQGDALLRWIAIVLNEESRAQVFRIGSDEFAYLTLAGTISEHEEIAGKVFRRLNEEAERLNLSQPLASMVVLHYTGEERFLPSDVIGQINSAMADAKALSTNPFLTTEAIRLPKARQWIVDNMIHRIISLGEMLDESQRLAYSDPLTNLPNMRAAIGELEKALQEIDSNGDALSVLLIDGDDLKYYNEISYAEGDKMIQRLGEVIKDQLRPNDFLARFRMGDEFLIFLDRTPEAQALVVAERLCQAVETASQSWPLPVTISIGVTEIAKLDGELHENVEKVLKQAEFALESAKDSGKNRVVAAIETEADRLGNPTPKTSHHD